MQYPYGGGSLKDFQIYQKIGEGAFSTVYQVKRLSDGQEYALKKVKMGNLKEKQRSNALNEVRILASINSEHIIGYQQAFIDDASASLCVIMEYAGGGDLQQKINNQIKKNALFQEEEIWNAISGISAGLKCLHDMKILHRDLKCANVFLTVNGIYKLGDLNVSKVAQMGMVFTQTGTPYYASPEVWRDEPYDSSSDIWSLGCVAYEMAALKPPFRAPDMDNLFKKVQKGVFDRIPNKFSNQLSQLISWCLRVQASTRPTARQVLETVQEARKVQQNLLEHTQHVQLLQTIKLPKSLSQLHGKLPQSNYKKLSNQSEVRLVEEQENDEEYVDYSNHRVSKSQSQSDNQVDHSSQPRLSMNHHNGGLGGGNLINNSMINIQSNENGSRITSAKQLVSANQKQTSLEILPNGSMLQNMQSEVIPVSGLRPNPRRVIGSEYQTPQYNNVNVNNSINSANNLRSIKDNKRVASADLTSKGIIRKSINEQSGPKQFNPMNLERGYERPNSHLNLNKNIILERESVSLDKAKKYDLKQQPPTTKVIGNEKATSQKNLGHILGNSAIENKKSNFQNNISSVNQDNNNISGSNEKGKVKQYILSNYYSNSITPNQSKVLTPNRNVAPQNNISQSQVPTSNNNQIINRNKVGAPPEKIVKSQVIGLRPSNQNSSQIIDLKGLQKYQNQPSPNFSNGAVTNIRGNIIPSSANPSARNLDRINSSQANRNDGKPNSQQSQLRMGEKVEMQARIQSANQDSRISVPASSNLLQHNLSSGQGSQGLMNAARMSLEKNSPGIPSTRPGSKIESNKSSMETINQKVKRPLTHVQVNSKPIQNNDYDINNYNSNGSNSNNAANINNQNVNSINTDQIQSQYINIAPPQQKQKLSNQPSWWG